MVDGRVDVCVAVDGMTRNDDDDEDERGARGKGWGERLRVIDHTRTSIA